MIGTDSPEKQLYWAVFCPREHPIPLDVIRFDSQGIAHVTWTLVPYWIYQEKCEEAIDTQADLLRQIEALRKESSETKRMVASAIQSVQHTLTYWKSQNVANLAATYQIPANLELVPKEAAQIILAAGPSVRADIRGYLPE